MVLDINISNITHCNNTVINIKRIYILSYNCEGYIVQNIFTDLFSHRHLLAIFIHSSKNLKLLLYPIFSTRLW